MFAFFFQLGHWATSSVHRISNIAFVFHFSWLIYILLLHHLLALQRTYIQVQQEVYCCPVTAAVVYSRWKTTSK